MKPQEIEEYVKLAHYSKSNGSEFVTAIMMAHAIYGRHPEWNNRVRNENKVKTAFAYLEEKYNKYLEERASQYAAFIEERNDILRAERLIFQLRQLLKEKQ